MKRARFSCYECPNYDTPKSLIEKLKEYGVPDNPKYPIILIWNKLDALTKDNKDILERNEFEGYYIQ